MAKQITTIQGLIKHEIQDADGDVICSFAYDPTDVKLYNRFLNASEKIEQINLENPTIEKLVHANEIIENSLNEVIGRNLFTVLSATCISADGEMFFEKILKIMADDLEKTATERAARLNDHAKKYLDTSKEFRRL